MNKVSYTKFIHELLEETFPNAVKGRDEEFITQNNYL
jgi:hypothetical protein